MSRFFKTSVLTIVSFILVLGSVVAHPGKASAACATLPTDKGTVTETISVPTTGTYRVWSRILAPDSTDNSFYMQIDNTLCKTSVGGNAADIGTNQWTWVDYHDGTKTSTIDVTLNAGSHTVTMAGEDAGVELDRVILTGDTSCTPTGTGDNCANPADTTPPVVSVTSPANNAAVSGTVSVAATATDNVGVAKVEFYVDGTLKATDATAPYTYSMDTSSFSVAPTVHTLYAIAYDTSTLSTQSANVNFTVNDISPPTVTLTGPTAGATLSGTAAMTATAADNVKVTKVEFYVDGTLEGNDTATPFSISLDTTALSNASHSFTAKAYDAAGNSTTSSAVSATVNNPVTPPPDTTAPVVSITSPANSATVSGTVNVNVTATDNVGVTKLEYYVDGALKKTDTAAPFTFSMDTTGFGNGTHALTVKAYDAALNVGTSSTVNVTVNNTTFLAEDINLDGHVNILDFSLLSAKFGQSGTSAQLGRADINADGTVNILDFSLLASKYGN